MKGKCVYWQKCRLYESCIVCNEMEGFAYGHRAGGCYRDISKCGSGSTYCKLDDKPQEKEKGLALRPI
ncbi:MAG: hypothetical protein WC566_02535 [Dehalococcoidia bacterium]